MSAQIPTKIANGIITNFLSSAGDFLDITLGGTGAVTAAAARTSLGLAIGTNVEAWSTELDGLAANTGSTGSVTRTGTGTYANRTMTAGGSGTMTITNGNGVSGNPTFELTTVTQGSSGTSFLKFQLNTFGQIINNTAVTTADITSLVNSTYLKLDGTNGPMTGLLVLSGDPTAALGAATKQYVDAIATGTGERATAFYATTASLPTNTYNNGTAGVGATLTGNANGALSTIDGQTPALNDLILVKNEGTTANNGFYKLTQVGTGGTPYILTRSVLADTTTKLSGMLVAVDLGTVNSGSLWLQTTTVTTVGTTSMTWTEINKAADIIATSPLNISGNTLSINTNGIGNTLIRQGVALSVIGVTGNATANVADIVGTTDQVLRVNGAGTALAFGTIATGGIAAAAVTYAKIQNETNATLLGNNSGGSAAPSEITVGTGLAFTSTTALGVATNGITNALFRQGGGLSVVGVTGSSTANVADITGTASTLLAVNAGGTSLSFTTLTTAMVGASQITYAKIQNEGAGTILGNGTGSPAAPQEITPTARFALTSGSLDLGNSGVTATTYGSGTLIPVITVDVYGRITSATTTGLAALPVATVATTAPLSPANTYANGTAGVGATLTATGNGTLTVDGVLTALNDYILVKNQASGLQNGLYQVTTAGTAGVPYVLTRVTAMDQTGEFSGVTVTVNGTGTVNASSLWLCTNTGSITVGTTGVTFAGLNKGNDITGTAPVTITNNAISIATNGITAALFRQSVAVSVVGNNTNATANVVDITSATNYAVLQANSTNTALSWGLITNNSITTNTITNANLRQGSGLSVIGVTGSSTANVADIVGTASTLLAVNAGGTSLAFTTLTTAMVGASQITYAKIQNEGAGTLLGNGTGSPAAPQEITPSARFAISSGALDLGNSGVTPGTYDSVTVDTYGRVTAATTTAANIPAVFTATNGEAGSIVIGAPVYVSASGTVKKAINTGSTTAFCMGLVNDVTVASSGTANIACYGVVTATTGQWDAVAGTTGGLTAGTRYFVGGTAGTLTSSIPGTGYLIEVGMALSSTVMILTIQQPIQIS
jgi:hypothetical protein